MGEAFGPAAGLPLLFWYSDGPVRAVPKVEGCFFKALAEAREGSAVSLNAANIGCRGREVLHRLCTDAALRAGLRVAEGALQADTRNGAGVHRAARRAGGLRCVAQFCAH